MIDFRARGNYPVVRYSVDRASWASGEDSAVEMTVTGVNCILKRMQVIASDTTNSITFTVAITDENGGTVLSIAGISDDATTDKNALKATPDFSPVVLANTLTVTVTPSGDPGASGATVDIILYGE